MGFVRVYTGDDGQSHFEDMDLLPPDVERSVAQATANITFGRSRNGSFSDWHTAPRRAANTLFSCPADKWRSGSEMGRCGDSVLVMPSCSKTLPDRDTPAGA